MCDPYNSAFTCCRSVILCDHTTQYTDETQFDIHFYLNRSASINKLTCISDVRAWMINNEKKMNDRKTYFLCSNDLSINLILVMYL